MSLTKIGPKHQVTIPKDAFRLLRLGVGDYLDAQVKGSVITLVPMKPVPRDQAWFHTPEWQQQEREADQAMARGDLSGPFASADELLRHLGKRRSRSKK